MTPVATKQSPSIPDVDRSCPYCGAMPVQGFGDPPRMTTMVCVSCDVTWRGSGDDECWSCGDASTVAKATPRKVRHTPAIADAERLVG